MEPRQTRLSDASILRLADSTVFVNYPTAAERLAALQALLSDIRGHQHKCDEAEFIDIVSRLTRRIAELEREGRESEITSRSED